MRIGESAFSVIYLLFAYTAGCIFLYRYFAGEPWLNRYYLSLAMMTLLLAVGDSFHLIPRIILNLNGVPKNKEFLLGLGNLVSSITMTLFYVLLFFAVYYQTYPYILSMVQPFLLNSFNRVVLCCLVFLSIIRIGLCLSPRNNWFKSEGNPSWPVIRNIPFLMIGIIMIIWLLSHNLPAPRNMMILLTDPPVEPHTILLAVLIAVSFACYIPVVLFAKKRPAVGMLMIPKTVCYMVMIGLFL